MDEKLGKCLSYCTQQRAITSTNTDKLNKEFPSKFLKAVFHKIYLVHFWILCPKYHLLVTCNTNVTAKFEDLNMKNKTEESVYPGNIDLLEVNTRNTRKRCKICSKLTIKTPERRHWLSLHVLSSNRIFNISLFQCNFPILYTLKL